MRRLAGRAVRRQDAAWAAHCEPGLTAALAEGLDETQSVTPMISTKTPLVPQTGWELGPCDTRATPRC